MSKIRLTPNASGTGTVTLTVPSTSTDRTITLPDTTGTLLDSSGQGVDVWYITANKTASSNTAPLDANWVRLEGNPVTNSSNPNFTYSGDMTGTIGNAMTESSGNFTFPSTGIYRIDFRSAAVNSNTSNDFYYPFILLTTDNFTNEGSQILAVDNIDNQATAGQMASCIFDVQDTSNYKCRFEVGSITNGYVSGDTNYMKTYVIFTRLGDT